MDLGVVLMVWMALWLILLIWGIFAEDVESSISYFFFGILSISVFLIICGVIEWLIAHVTIAW